MKTINKKFLVSMILFVFAANTIFPLLSFSGRVSACVPPPPPTPICGNAILETGEECDDGNIFDGDGCSANCTIEQQCIAEGESGAVVPEGPQCCDGLTQIGCDQPDPSGECSQECVGAFYCTMCGDGVCGLGENQCNCPEDCTANIYAFKVVCDAEEYLPNWGDGQDVPMITEQVVNDFVAQNSQYCHLESDWDFEWGRNGEAQKQNGDYIGFAPDGTGWNDFDSSTGASPAEVNLNAQDINSTGQIWVREVLKEGYIPFSYPPSNSQDNVSAEMYCHQDVLNYDNYDYIINPQLGQDYYCVAFNAPVEQEPYCELELTKTDDVDPVQAGDQIIYHLNLKNTGTANCTGGGVRVKDVFDQNTSYVSSSKTPEQITDTYIKWNFGTLTPGEEENFDLTMQVSQDVQCGTILENKAKYWSDQTGWGEFVTEETTVRCENELTIHASKIVCQTETDLPNWGNGGPDITSTTAQSFVDGNQNCHLASGWDFEWAQAGTANPGDNIIGPAGAGWTTFGPTDVNGIASVNIGTTSGDRIWVREVMKEGFIPFSGDTSAPRDNVSAELYCHQDVLNYDNYDYILNPQLDQDYYCVGFNVATGTEPTTSTLIVIDHVIGGTATSGNFTVSVTGTNPVPASFPGEEAPGTTVIIDQGSYDVTQSTLPDYTTSYSENCSSTILAGETKTCIITNNYNSGPFCGDGICNGGEICSTCWQDCGHCGGGYTPYCGDGIINGSEQCDGKAGISEGYICTVSCTLEKSVCTMDINVMMVMDVSGSMNFDSPTRLSMAKNAANGFIDNLRERDQSGLVSFSWTAILNKKLSNDHDSTQSFIQVLAASGATNIGEAIGEANKELISVASSPSIARIEILLTDGRANQPNGNGSNENSADIALALAKSLEAAENGIIIFTIGLGSDVNGNMLDTIAKNTGGKYYFAPAADDLEGIFNQIASETCKSASFVTPAVSIFNPRIAEISSTRVVVSWYTNIPATSRVVYGEQKVSTPEGAPNYGYDFSTPEQDTENKAIFHSVAISGLNPNKTYYWRPVSGASPEVLGDEELIFTTKPEGSVAGEETSIEDEEISNPEVDREGMSSGVIEVSEREEQEEESQTSSQSNEKFLTFLSKGLASVFDTVGKTYSLIALIVGILFVLYLISKKKKKTQE